MTLSLEEQLNKSGVDTSTWGSGTTKTVKGLENEINEGESTLEKDSNGVIFRKVIIADLYIYHVSEDNKKFKLKESKQIFKSGKERIRDLGQTSVSEKIKKDETPEECAFRGMKEELGITSNIKLRKLGIQTETKPSTYNYPNLKTEYTRHQFECILNNNQFNKEGYTEIQEDKTTYFVWEEIQD